MNYRYDAAGMRTATQLFSQGNEVVTTSQTYDGLGRLTQIRHGDIAQYDYSWDAANRITAMNDAEYGYDQTSQLVSAEYETLPKELYEYDANGNRKAFETGKNNQLLSDGVFDYKYDDEGNRIEKWAKTGEMTKYLWDHRNRLVQVIMPKGTVMYSYDYLNRMTRRNDDFIIHDGWQIVLMLDSKGNVKERNFWGANQDELIATNGQFALCDHLGSVRDVVNADGKVIEHREYNAFGKVTKQTGKSASVFGYTGKMFDDTTGLQWNVNRWYDAKVGRWISEDPIGFEAGSANLVSYVGNVPTTHNDILGLSKQSVTHTFTFQVPQDIGDHAGGHTQYYTANYEVVLEYTASCANGKSKMALVGITGNLLWDIDTLGFQNKYFTFGMGFDIDSKEIPVADPDCPNNRPNGQIEAREYYIELYFWYGVGIASTPLEWIQKHTIGSTTIRITNDCCFCRAAREPSNHDCYECDAGHCNGRYIARVPRGNPPPNPEECLSIPFPC